MSVGFRLPLTSVVSQTQDNAMKTLLRAEEDECECGDQDLHVDDELVDAG